MIFAIKSAAINPQTTSGFFWNNRGPGWIFNVNRTCANQVNIPSITKISFTLINELYDFEANPNHLRFLESASINVNNGRLAASYTFSPKIYIPNFTKIGEGIASVKNLLR